MMRPGLIWWSSMCLAALPACERATPSPASLSASRTEPEQVIAPLAPRVAEATQPEQQSDEMAPPAAREGASAPAAAAGQDSVAAEKSATAEKSVAAEAIATRRGAPSARCVNGWITPGRGNPLRKAALDMIRARKSERFVVVEMRYFRGPEDAEVIGPQREVERWYVKAYSTGRNPRSQRWLVRRAEVGRGIDAVADFDSTGYAPGTWKRPDASDDSVSDPFQRPCLQPSGEKCMGLPYAVLGCLDGS